MFYSTFTYVNFSHDRYLLFIDRKSLKSEERKRIEGLLSDGGLPVLRSREIIAEFPFPPS